MLIQNCLKGIVERQNSFSDIQAISALQSEGLSASWLRAQRTRMSAFAGSSHSVLSQNALDAHVNGFGKAKSRTPYFSLSAGCVELDPATKMTTAYSALQTALEFATEGGSTSGYVFRLWVLVSPKPAPELPGFAEEVRELNLFRQYAVYHYEGEVAAKLFIPARQIEWVDKFDASLSRLWRQRNPNFVKPERVSNVLEML
ncbi:hypothetical protein HGO38_02525 [Rhizobium sp. CG5]|uniref:hypothetical protein n=1 Tax=Rhizobium sp. CG5 TaxID=2726076 RepID=UPI002033D23D|nr:hypothetical protein [Rhizobium sp. CG5]MCM2472348.1 hypothetical protein [Rhizobium sp. CG5]